MTRMTQGSGVRPASVEPAATPAIMSFRGENAFLSNMHPCTVVFEGATYASVEHAYQAAKSLDPKERKAVADLPTPKGAKARGKRVKLRDDWESVKLSVMERCLRSKFADSGLRAQLIATGDAELVEGNTWNDRFWGVCRGKGQNQLGKILMKLREEFRAG